MTLTEFLAFLPVAIPGFAAVVLMLLIAFRRNHFAAALTALIGLGASIGSVLSRFGGASVSLTPLFTFDDYAAVFLVLLFAAAAVSVLLSYGYLSRYRGNREEYYLMLLLATTGGAVLAAGTHFVSLLLGIEILSVSLYALVAYPHASAAQAEAAVKYLILAAVSSAFLIFGMALVFAGTGALDFTSIGRLFRDPASVHESRLLLSGLSMILVGMGFKLSLVPFHLWAPDVYQGAPAPVSGFVATVSKGSVIATMVRFFSPMDLRPGDPLYWALAAVAVLSMLAGNLLALFQDNVKRILGCSSIAHIGYLLVAFLAGGRLAKAAVAFYLAAYFVTVLGAFGVVTVVSDPDGEAQRIEDYSGLFWRRPWVAGTFAAMLFSLAGIPLTAGFTGKFYLVASGVETARWGLILSLVVSSTIGLYYYLRVVAALFARTPQPAPERPLLPASGCLMLGLLVVFLLWLGVLPAPLINLLQTRLQ